MEDVTIGPGNLAGKGVFANRDFEEGEVVIKYNLTPLSEKEFDELPEGEKEFTHTQHGQIYLYSVPERYVNHSSDPNTRVDHDIHADVARRNIKRGEAITGNATEDDVA